MKAPSHNWKDLPFIVRRDRHHRVDWCYREKGRPSQMFRSVPGTPEFIDEYWAIRCAGLSEADAASLKANPRQGLGRSGQPTRDLTGKRFGQLIVLRRDGVIGKLQQAAWLCRCDCGTEKTIRGASLQNQHSPTWHCGCLRKQNIANAVKTHGLSKTRLAKTLWSIKHRIDNPAFPGFKNYGGRGIKLCDRWRYGENGMSAVECFIADMGPRPEGMSIDRIDVNGDYEPGNCRWATALQQLRNTRKTVLIEFNGETRCLAEWAQIVGISTPALTYRLSAWPIERALGTPRRSNWAPPKKAA